MYRCRPSFKLTLIFLSVITGCSSSPSPVEISLPVPDPASSEPASVSGWEASDKGMGRTWTHGHTKYRDTNGDGKPDWKIIEHGADDYSEKEDRDFDGYFDRRYRRGPSGIPDRVESIHEKTPAP